MDGWMIIASNMSILATLSFSQTEILFTYLLAFIFSLARSYDWIEDLGRYINFNVFLLMTFMLLIFFSRGFHHKERLQFNKMKN
jgi:hypothetical protein